MVRATCGAGPRPRRGPGHRAGVRLRRLRLRRRLPRAPEGRALRPPARPPPRHPARDPDQPRHLAPVPARVAQPPPVRHPGQRQPTRDRSTASRCTTCCGSCTSRGRVSTPRTSTTCSWRTGSTTTIACAANWRDTPTVPVTGGGARARDDASPLLAPSDDAVHGDRAARRARGCTTACSTHATTRRAGVERPRRRRRAGASAGVGARAARGGARSPAAGRVRAPQRRGRRRPRAVPPRRRRPARDRTGTARRVTAIRSEVAFAGVADPDVCHRCSYRSICPDSAVAGVPIWPVVEAEDEE